MKKRPKYRVVHYKSAYEEYYTVLERFLYFFWTSYDADDYPIKFRTKEEAIDCVRDWATKPSKEIVYEQ